MKGTRGDLRTWGNLVLLGLCSWTGARVAALNPVRNLSVEAQTTSSITLSWTEPADPDPSNYTSWIQWAGDGGKAENKSTTRTTVIMDGLYPGSLYEFVMWVEKNRVSSSNKTWNTTAAPNPVRNLSVEAQTTSSVTLSWIEPADPDPSNYTYWIQWSGNETKSTTSTSVIVDGLQAGSLYEFVVWVEKNGVNSSNETCNATTAPNPVRNLSVEAQTTSSVTLSWIEPADPDPSNYTYWIQWSGNETKSTTSTSVIVDGLQPGSLYEFVVWVEKNGVTSSNETCNTTTAPNPVRNLSVEAQTTSSVTLSWIEPADPDPSNYTYWIQWSGNETKSTTSTSVIVDGLQAGSLYEFVVWVEKNGVNSSNETCNATTAPNPVRNLSVEAQTTSSVTLSWIEPADPDPSNYTYWIQWSGNETKSTTSTSVIVDGLQPGSLYEFVVWVEKNGVTSSNETCNTTTAPNPVRNLSVEAQTTSSVTLSWIEPADPDPSNYTYWIQWSGNETKSTTSTSVIVDGLQAGSLYEFVVWVEKNGVNSSNETCNATTAPNPVRNLSVEAQTTSSVTLSWIEPADPDPSNYTYWIQWSGNETKSTTSTSVIVDGLQAGSLYEFVVWVEKNGVSSANKTCNATTVPNAVTSLGIQDQTNSSITLSWTAPLGPDQPPYTYWVSWVKEGIIAINTQDTPDTSITLKELEAGSLYTFTVWAERNRVSSDSRTLTEATAPNRVTDLHNETQTNSSITLGWKAPKDSHSQTYTYWVQWAPGGHPQGEQDPREHQASQRGRTNETRYEVQALEPGTLYNLSVWTERNNVTSWAQSLLASTAPSPVTIMSCISTSGGYGVILTWSCPQGGYEAFEWQVGGQGDSQNRSSCGRSVSVSDLRPAQSYTATVTTIWDGMRAPSVSVTCHTDNAGVIAGAIFGVILFLILVGLLIFFLKKRHNKSQREPAPRGLVFSLSKDILAEDFADHIRKNEMDSNYGFEKEYQQLYLGSHNQSQTVASAPENGAKNRYRNVLPYDWSRVSLKPLQDEPGSDYINASFMPGLENPQEFIAAQGPLPQTVGDFWRLVWEQQSHTLVMLTNCVESGQVKCEHYWPLDTKPCTYGHLQVTLEGEEVLENWTVRDLKLWHMQEQKMLHIRQFHYMTWPDHSVPYSPDPILAFWKMLRQWLDQTVGGGPPIIHCSAGVGRTGTLIALDVLLRQLERDRCVRPFNYVRKMRESRPLMVQTEAQYVFLHQCILRFLQQPDQALTENGAAYENPLYKNI